MKRTIIILCALLAACDVGDATSGNNPGTDGGTMSDGGGGGGGDSSGATSAPAPDTDRPAPIQAEPAIMELATVADRNRIVEIVLGFAAGTFEATVLFAVRDHMAFGWKAIGPLPGRAHVDHLLIPLDSPSIVQAAVAAESGVINGPPSPSTVNSYLFKVLGCPEPRHATAAVITIGKRVVNVLYGHGPELTPLQLEDVRQVCLAAAEAYARLIAGRKKHE
jgi:hypothetical protein